MVQSVGQAVNRQAAPLFGQRLKEAREAAGLSARAVAKEADIHTQSVYGYEAGTWLPSPEFLAAWSKVVGVDWRPLLRDSLLESIDNFGGES